MAAHHWPQGIEVKSIEEILTNNSCPKPANTASVPGGGGNNNNLERKANRPQKEQALNCPRCNSTNTKFCYYNNYSLTQPRYFCKSCRRYWTAGGSLRNIPVGGGSRKNKRSSTQSNSSTTTTSNSNNISSIPKRQPQQQLPDLIHGQDLNLSTNYPADFRNVISDHHYLQNPNKSSPSSATTTTTTTSHLSAMELLTGLTSRGGGFNSFMSFPIQDPNNNTTTSNNTVPSGNNMIPMHDFKPTLNFSLDGLGNGYGPLPGVQESNGRLLFPFEDLKQLGGHGDQTSKDHGDSTGYWTGMLGGGSSW